MTLEEFKTYIQNNKERIEQLCEFLKVEEREAEILEIQGKMSAPDFWDKKETAQEVVANLSICKNITEPYKKLLGKIEDLEVLLEMAEEDPDMLAEADESCKQLSEELDKVELLSFMAGPFDANGVFVSIHAGAGGTESCDWANMLLRMYRRWFERRGWKDEIIEMQPGDEAGIKSVTLRVQGEFAYGYAKAEKGVHRLVRISPFDSAGRRHTSFASVDIFPELNDDIDIDIDESDLKVDTYRASGAGGQHVNTTDSAIRITHVPTGAVVACQSQRSQHKNRATAMKMLKAKLYEIEDEKRRSEADELRGVKTEMGWGSQIRSYVLHPYQMVKDLRTNIETGNTSAVLDGDLDQFVEGWLKSSRKTTRD
ncbi:MAG: peptide chain release factor 2 [Victivallaceae bacterium]|nr:peptide chain release factor 2 [Victivallaceae bacterium]